MDRRPASRMSRFAGPAVALVALLVGALAILGWLNAPPRPPALLLERVVGEVRVERPGTAALDGAPGLALQPDDRVQTGAGGSAVLKVGDLAEIGLEGTSDLRVREVGASGFAVDLDGGRATAEVRAGSPALEIRSGSRANRTVRSSDGTFRVGVRDGVTAAEVLRGQADLAGFGTVDRLAAGQRAVSGDAGIAVLSPIPESLVLDVQWPEDRRTRELALPIVGRAPPGSRIQILGSGGLIQVVADADGRFTASLPLREGEQPVVVTALDPLGEPLVERVTIERDTTPPALRGGVEAAE